MLKKMPIIFQLGQKKNRTTQHSENQNKGNKQRHEYNKAKGK